jgi:hypothetical protein
MGKIPIIAGHHCCATSVRKCFSDAQQKVIIGKMIFNNGNAIFFHKYTLAMYHGLLV